MTQPESLPQNPATDLQLTAAKPTNVGNKLNLSFRYATAAKGVPYALYTFSAGDQPLVRMEQVVSGIVTFYDPTGTEPPETCRWSSSPRDGG